MTDEEMYARADYLPQPVEYPAQDETGVDWLQIATGVMLWVVLLLGAVAAHHAMSAWMVAR